MFNVMFIMLLFFTTLTATSIDIGNDLNNSLVKDDAVNFSLELGARTDFWTPGLSKNVIDYKTEGLLLGYGKVKLKLYNSDIITIEKYTTLNASHTQNDLLEYYKDDRNHESNIDGLRVSVQLIKILNYLFEQEWLNGFNYEYNSRNFVGDATLKTDSAYWYGEIDGGVRNKDFSLLEKEDKLSFKTKFTSHKLFYRWDNVLKKKKGTYCSLGIFDEEWSKPTFIQDRAIQKNLPIIFDANYYAKGIATTVGIKNNIYDINAFFNFGLSNKMEIIQKENKYSNLNKDINMYMIGANANYRFTNIYKHERFTTDIVVGAQIQYNKINQKGNIELDAEKLYGLHAGVEIIF